MYVTIFISKVKALAYIVETIYLLRYESYLTVSRDL